MCVQHCNGFMVNEYSIFSLVTLVKVAQLIAKRNMRKLPAWYAKLTAICITMLNVIIALIVTLKLIAVALSINRVNRLITTYCKADVTK